MVLFDQHRPQSNFYFIEFPQNQVSSDFFQQDSGIDSFEVATASTKGNNVKKAKRRGRANNGPSIPPTNNGRRPTRRKEEPAPTEPALTNEQPVCRRTRSSKRAVSDAEEEEEEAKFKTPRKRRI